MPVQQPVLRCPFLLVILLAAGCSRSDGIDDTVPVSGTVELDGVPIARGFVVFVPEPDEPGQLATGRVEKGRFTMMTSVSAPGVVMGSYGVQVESYAEPNQNSQESFTIPRNLVPEKYRQASKSGLQIDVVEGMEPLHLVLKSGHKK